MGRPYKFNLYTFSKSYLFLRHLKYLVPKDYLKNAYYAFFNSILLYGIHIWGNCYNVSKVLLMQKQAIRILTGSSYDAHCKPLFISEKILTVINLYIYHSLIRLKNNLSEYNTRSQFHDYATRNNHCLEMPTVRLTKSKRCFDSMAIMMFNRLPYEAFIVNHTKFKVVLHSWLIHNPFYSISEFLESPMNICF